MANGMADLHVQNKAEIVAVVCNGVTPAMHAEMNGTRIAMTNSAERVACGTRHFILIAADEPVWGRLLLPAFAEFDAIKASVSRYMRLDVELGASQGHFAETRDAFVIDCHLAILRMGIAVRLGGAGQEVGARAAEYQSSRLGFAGIRPYGGAGHMV